MSELHKPQVAIMASGEGTTAVAFMLAVVAGRIDAEVPLVISNNREPAIFQKVGFLNRAHRLGTEMLAVTGADYPLRRGEERARGLNPWQSERMARLMQDYDVDHVALMGFMKIVTGDLLSEYGYLPEQHTSIYQARMSNTHPGPLPLTADTMGAEASAKVLAAGRKTSEHTVHLVSAGVDQGPVIARHRVKAVAGDTKATLFRRVHEVEMRELPRDIDLFLQEQTVYYGHPEAG
ncbi:MAG TPA: formyltransferase family protein [Candidatus Saccharimonadales bacterium]|nr:formyltransferase family protein [Candidatus Saccharimonadales bacterium]